MRKLRKGLRVRADYKVDKVVRAAVLKFVRWLRRQFAFPIRVPLYLSSDYQLKTRSGNRVSAFFFMPYEKGVEPYIKVATGDYPEMKKSRGRNNALASILGSVAHEVLHYSQWIETGQTKERGVAVKARFIIRKYAQDVKQP